ncbi:uncharacterized protein LOC135114897 [Scylla paramamosain]|uniref:uncharacterized protein LOC135114897 n=1 Tax=Scylla paramamosain TaxID=85552 RepID=UPI00308343B1
MHTEGVPPVLPSPQGVPRGVAVPHRPPLRPQSRRERQGRREGLGKMRRCWSPVNSHQSLKTLGPLGKIRSHDLSHTLDLTMQLARTILRRSESLLTSLSQPSSSNSPRSSPNVACHKR